jgi:hypothetical protein
MQIQTKEKTAHEIKKKGLALKLGNGIKGV